ncbi:MAG: carboxypeptidase regulatory-like domain-containing protein [Salinivirgaceae bacterium]
MRKFTLLALSLLVFVGLSAQNYDAETLAKMRAEKQAAEIIEMQSPKVQTHPNVSKEDILMQTGTVTTCDGTFYDTGGPDGAYQISEDLTLTILPATDGAQAMVTFTMMDIENNYDFLKVYNGTSVDGELLADLTGSTMPTEPFIASNADGALTFHFTSDGSVTKPGWAATVECFTLVGNNLAAAGIEGTPFATANTEKTFGIKVKNMGTETAVGADYDVQLLDANDNVLGTATGVDLATNEEAIIDIAWTPTVAGMVTVHGYVDFAADENMDNNTTGTIEVEVMEEGTHVAQVGTDETFPPSRVPFDFFFKNSASQTIYTPDQLGISGGAILSIAYENSFATDLSAGKPVKVWIGETTQADLSEGWVDPSTLTPVYDGVIEFPAGQNVIPIQFNEPYIYGGGNLVIYTYRVFEDEYHSSSDKFYGTEISESNCTRRNSSDTEFDSSLEGTEGTAISWTPNTTIYFSTAGLGALEGNVASAGTGVEGVKVQIVDAFSNTITDANGDYSFPYLLEGMYNLELSKYGYESTIISDVEVIGDETTIADATIEPIPTYSVSGTVVASHSNLGLQGAEILFEGYETYTSTTDVNGEFTIDGVYGNGRDYYVTVDYEGYSTYTTTVTVNDADVTGLEFSVEEIIVEPYGLVVSQDGDAANFSWNNAMGFTDDFESYEDFIFENIGDYTQVDEDGGPTYGFQGVTFPNAEYTGSFIVFNPSQTTPALEDPEFQPYSGSKYLVCFASTTPPNSDWLITPEVSAAAGTQVSFMAKSITDEYGLERFKVAVSTTGTNPADFTVISDGEYVEAPLDWTEFAFDLSDYAGQNIHIAIQCVSNDAFMFMVDDLTIGMTKGKGKAFNGYTVYLDGNEEATGVSETNYTFEGLGVGTYTAGVKAIYDSGESDIMEVEFAILPEVTFVVKDEDDNLLEGATVTMEGVDYTTDINGEATMLMEVGSHDYTVVMHGYYDATGTLELTNDVIVIEEVVQMIPVPVYDVTFNVAENWGPNEVVSDATVTFTDGTTTWEGFTDASGTVTFTDIFKLNGYEYTVTASNLVDTAGTFDVVDANASVNVFMDEFIGIPAGLEVTVDGSNAEFSWTEPGIIPVEFLYDNGVQTGQLGSSEGTDNTVLGSVHRVNAQLHEVSWFTTGEGGPHATVNVFIFDLDENGQPTSDVLFSAMAVENTDMEWNTLILDEAVDAPNGFMVGVSYAGFLGLGTTTPDDNFPFIENTQYFSGDYTGGEFAAVETLGDPSLNNNFMVRAYGYDMGRATATPSFAYRKARSTKSDLELISNDPVLTEAPVYSFDGTNKKELTGYTIYLDGNEEATGVTDLTYTFTGLTPGVHTAGVAANYETGDSEVATIEFEVMSSVTFNFTDDANGDALEGVSIEISEEGEVIETLTTDATGNASIELYNGAYDFTATLDNYGTIEESFTVAGADLPLDYTMVGMNDLAEAQLAIYPNPSNGNFNITVDGEYEVTVVNSVGQVVHNEVIVNNSEISLENVVSGLYIVTVKSNDKFAVQSIVIE